MQILFDKYNMWTNPVKFLRATKEGNNKKAKHYLKRIKHPRYLVDNAGKTLLHYAVKFSNMTIAQHLIEIEGCNVNADDKFGVTALSMAVQNREHDIVEILLDNNADIHLPDYSGMSPLQLIARKCICARPNDVFAEYSLIMGFLMKRVNEDFFRHERSTIELLLKENDLVKCAIAVFGCYHLAKCLLKHDKQIIHRRVDRYGYTPLHCAIIQAQVINTVILMDEGPDVSALDAFGHTALYYYTAGMQELDGHSEILELLLAEIGESTPQGLERLLSDGNKRTVTTVLQSAIDISAMSFESNQKLLHLLAINKNCDVMQALDELSVKYDVNARDENGATPLYYAAYRGRAKQVEFLLSRGADANLNVNSGVTILEVAAKTVYVKTSNECQQESAKIIVELLLQHGAIVNRSLIFGVNGQYGRLCKDRYSSEIIVLHLAILAQLDDWPLTDITRAEVMSCYLLSYDASFMRVRFDSCMRQLDMMKAFAVNSTITLFQLLTESQHQIAIYLRNRDELTVEIAQVLTNYIDMCEDIGIGWDTYCMETLRNRIKRALDTNQMARKAAPIIEHLTGISCDVYQHIVRRIISCLGYHDLRNLCKLDVDDDVVPMDE